MRGLGKSVFFFFFASFYGVQQHQTLLLSRQMFAFRRGLGLGLGRGLGFGLV